MEEKLDDLSNAFDIFCEINSETLELQNNIDLLDDSKNLPENNVITPGKLLEDYTNLELEKEKIDIKILELKEQNKEIFELLEKYQNEISELDNKQSEMRQEITNSIENAGLTERGISNDIFKIKYVAATTRQNFNKDKFKAKYPVLFNQFITTSDVKSYIKITKKEKK